MNQFVRFLKSSKETVLLGGFLRDLAYLQYNHPSQDKFVSSMLLREIVRQYLNENLQGWFELSPSPKHVFRGNSNAVISYHPHLTPNPAHHLYSHPSKPPISPKSIPHDHLTFSAEDATEGVSETCLRLCEVGSSVRTSTSAADVGCGGDNSDIEEHIWKLHYTGDLSSITVDELLVIGAKAFESITAALFDSFLQSIHYARYV
ncbi:hypothetical protein EON63_02835 [archaeon]|nr:MAG: hypothetical protein EON63_02835 [archaeon]